MKIYIFTAIMMGVIFLSSAAKAQQSSSMPPSIPPGPLVVNNVGKFARWAVIITPLSAVAKSTSNGKEAHVVSPAVIQTQLFTKTGSTLRLQTFNGSLLVEDRWIIGDTQVVAPPESSPFISRPAQGISDISYNASDFPELSWISKEKYEGTIQDKKTGKKVMIFRGVSANKNIDGVESKKGVAAMIDLETRLPMSFQEEGALRSYKFLKAPTLMQQVSPAVKGVLDADAKNQAICNRGPGKP